MEFELVLHSVLCDAGLEVKLDKFTVVLDQSELTNLSVKRVTDQERLKIVFPKGVQVC